jgi:hypothetical protein
MSKNQEIKNSENRDNPGRDKAELSRRQFTKAGLLASPILMSVVSRPAIGAACLSNMLSGNLSDPDRGSCNLGLSPGYWKNHPDVWPMGAASYKPDGSIPSGCSACEDSSGWICSGGPLFNSYFTTRQDPENRTMHEMICTMPGSEQFHIIAALLNAMTDPNYVLSVAQVKALWADPTLGGSITTSLNDFLDSTWT